MVSKYSRVAWLEGILESPPANVISVAQAKQTSFHIHIVTTAKRIWPSKLKATLSL